MPADHEMKDRRSLADAYSDFYSLPLEVDPRIIMKNLSRRPVTLVSRPCQYQPKLGGFGAAGTAGGAGGFGIGGSTFL